MKIKKRFTPIIMLLQVTVATVLLVIAITNNVGLIKFVYIALLVCVLISSALVVIEGYKKDK